MESTPWRPTSSPPDADHLHVRGEHGAPPPHPAVGRGPPPRAWRARAGRLRRPPERRTTSTCVESTHPPSQGGSHGTDHLHVRGEHPCPLLHHQLRFGPPPRAWRALTRGALASVQTRTTSTCVESTARGRRSGPADSDHLHVRGEHDWPDRDTMIAGGPPPRAWRALLRGGTRFLPLRTTSTCVESTAPGPALARREADHLHVRGEHGGAAHTLAECDGPPPRAWRAPLPEPDRQGHDLSRGGPPPRAWRALVHHARELVFERTTSTCVESTTR